MGGRDVGGWDRREEESGRWDVRRTEERGGSRQWRRDIGEGGGGRENGGRWEERG